MKRFVLVLVALLAFGGALRAPFLFDDAPSIVRNTTIEELSSAALHAPKGSPVAGGPSSTTASP